MAKCLEIGEAKEIPGRFGNTRKVAEATLADESGAIIMSLWDEQIGTVAKDDTVHVKNGYVSLVRGHMRLNVGKYGNLLKAEKAVETTATEPNLSEKEYEMERKRYSGGGGDRGGGRPRSGGDRGGSRDYGSGSRDNDDRPKYMNKGRRRF